MIETDRLVLRRWRMREARDYRAIAGEPRVAATLGAPPTLARARAIVTAQNALLDAAGHCFWAVHRRDRPGVIGWCGLKLGPDHSPIAGAPELGWTFHPDHHGQGLATEAARAVVAWAWAQTDHPRLFAITSSDNRPSRAVMERLGMSSLAGGDFDHPALGPDDPLRRHVTFVLERPAVTASAAPTPGR